jgi:hypothetical protein
MRCANIFKNRHNVCLIGGKISVLLIRINNLYRNFYHYIQIEHGKFERISQLPEEIRQPF